MRLAKVDSGGTLIRITFYHTLEGETYAVHAHDYDPDSTIGQPYEFAVNTEVLNQNPVGNGDTVEVTQYSPYSTAYLKEEYQGLFYSPRPLAAGADQKACYLSHRGSLCPLGTFASHF
jgi:hypothetical protein